MQTQNNKNEASSKNLIIITLVLFFINPFLAFIFIIWFASTSKKDSERLSSSGLTDLLQSKIDLLNSPNSGQQLEPLIKNIFTLNAAAPFTPSRSRRMKLEKRKQYLQIALNGTLADARSILSQLPSSERILIEAGTPLIKTYGTRAISQVRALTPPGTYIVADNKCADLAEREVEMMAAAGANAATCLGVAPVETIDAFIAACKAANIDSMLDMMNVESAISVLKKLHKLPDVVILHRGVDESELAKDKKIPFYQIKQIKGSFDILVAVAGGDTIREVQSAIFNDADIVVVWKNFYTYSDDTARLADSFLKEVK